MQLIFQNSKQLKQVRQFIKGLGYVYDSITKKQKEIYLYVSNSYIAIVNNFINTQVPNYKVCFCKLKKHMYKLRNFYINQQQQQQQQQTDNQGLIYYLDVQLILKLLNTQVQSDITQMTITFPLLDAQGENQYQMKLSYEADGLKGYFKLFTRLQHTSWPFKQGVISQSCIQNSCQLKFLTLPSKLVKQIEYYKRVSEFWLCLSPEVINIKRTQGSYIISDQIIKCEQLGEYDYYNINQKLRGNINININSQQFFHHLQQANKENRRTHTKIIIQKQYYESEHDYNESNGVHKKYYLYMYTVTERREIHELFEILPRVSINYKEVGIEVQRLKLKLKFKDAKKEEEDNDERLVLNRFYGPEYEETVRLDMVNRETIVRINQPKGEETNSRTMKSKVQM